jgi:hypothetical protein
MIKSIKRELKKFVCLLFKIINFICLPFFLKKTLTPVGSVLDVGGKTLSLRLKHTHRWRRKLAAVRLPRRIKRFGMIAGLAQN